MTAPTAPEKAKFVVLTSAVTIRTGKEKRQVQRFLRGQVIALDVETVGREKLKRLVRLGAIAVAKVGKAYKATTADIARQRAGADDDPVPAPVTDVQPITPDDAITTPAPEAEGTEEGTEGEENAE